MGPGRAPATHSSANPINARAAVARARASFAATRRASRITTSISQPIVPTHETETETETEPEPEIETVKDHPQSEMDVEELDDQPDDEAEANEREVENMVGVEQSDEDEQPAEKSKYPRIWPEIGTERACRYAKELQTIRETFHDEVDAFDTTMVSEYADDIFEYMCDLEVWMITEMTGSELT